MKHTEREKKEKQSYTYRKMGTERNKVQKYSRQKKKEKMSLISIYESVALNVIFSV